MFEKYENSECEILFTEKRVDEYKKLEEKYFALIFDNSKNVFLFAQFSEKKGEEPAYLFTAKFVSVIFIEKTHETKQ